VEISWRRAPGHQQVFLQHEGDVRIRTADEGARHPDSARARRGETCTEIEQGAFAAARRTDQRHHLSLRYVECDLGGGEQFGVGALHPETLVDADELDCWREGGRHVAQCRR
jgi:hypothetical protein